jgi:hypothetical protein
MHPPRLADTERSLDAQDLVLAAAGHKPASTVNLGAAELHPYRQVRGQDDEEARRLSRLPEHDRESGSLGEGPSRVRIDGFGA